MPQYRWPPQMRLKLHLVERGITTKWLAETVGLSVVTTTGILTGRVRPTPRSRALIAEALGMPAAWLFVGVEDPTEGELAQAGGRHG
jgi:transcriptional regulator with XRE-family HTH domain